MTETELLDFARSRKGVDVLLTRKEVSLWTRKTEPKEVARRALGMSVERAEEILRAGGVEVFS